MKMVADELYLELEEVMPGGVSSPVRAARGHLGTRPLIAERGFGATVTDCAGKDYIDYCMSWGALIHGHVPPQVIEPVIERLRKGTSFGMTTLTEWRLAQKIVEIVPGVDKVRFVSSGTEATMSAARLARGYTGRDLIIKFTGNYHGHADLFLVQAGSGVALLAESSSKGVPFDAVKNTISLTYNDIDEVSIAIREAGDRLAAVIVEPVSGNMGVVPANGAFMAMLREETRRVGALLIFDEVITGFRVALQGAQALYPVEPDLFCFGKIIGGGFPAAAFGGSAEVMDHLAPAGSVYQAGTLSGNPVAMEAGLRALELLQVPGVYEELERKTRQITDPLRALIEERGLNACVQQVGSLFTLFFGRRSVSHFEEARACDHEKYNQFFESMREAGIIVPPLQYEALFVSLAHSDRELAYTAECFTSKMVS